jgi:nucleotide-binding universal stress UspA family protein
MSRVVVWITEDAWQACVDAAALFAPADAEIVLLHVVEPDVAEALRRVHGGLLGEGGHDPGDEIERLAHLPGYGFLVEAAHRLGHKPTTLMRTGRPEHEVVHACEGADLLVCARDGESGKPGPHSIGAHTRYVVDHAPCAVLLVWPDTDQPR